MEENTDYKRFVGVALVVVRRGNEYVSVEEHTGWYLPAGRVDYGEAFTTGAIRETDEEAGLKIKLTGIYRIEQYAFRMRIIFGAVPVDDNAPLKSIPDSETLQAEWVTLEQLKKKKLRHKEVFSIFNFVENGAPLYPLDVYEGQNGKEIDNKNVITHLLHKSKIVLQRLNLFLGIKKDSEVILLSQIMPSNIRQHKENAASLLLSHHIPVTVSGLYKVEHVPPQSRDNPYGTLTIIFSTTGDTDFEIKEPLLWCAVSQFSDETERKLLENITEGKQLSAPISIITLEGEGL